MSRGAVMTHPAEELFRRHRRSRPPVSVHPSPVHWALLPVSGPGSSPRLRTFRAAHFCHKGGYRALARTHTDEKEFDLSRGLFLFQRAAAHRIGDPFPAVAHPPSPLVPHSLGRPFNNSPPPPPQEKQAHHDAGQGRLGRGAAPDPGRVRGWPHPPPAAGPRHFVLRRALPGPVPGRSLRQRRCRCRVWGRVRGLRRSGRPASRRRADHGIPPGEHHPGAQRGRHLRAGGEAPQPGQGEDLVVVVVVAAAAVGWASPDRGGGGGGGGGDTCRAPSPPLKSKHRPIA